jgi:hypothetical protein
MMTQNSLLDYQPSIEASYSSANEVWKQEATATVQLLIKRGNDFSADDVHEILEAKGVFTHNNSALGAIFQKFSRQGYIRFIRHTNSVRKSRHMASVRVWRPMSRLANV